MGKIPSNPIALHIRRIRWIAWCPASHWTVPLECLEYVYYTVLRELDGFCNRSYSSRATTREDRIDNVLQHVAMVRVGGGEVEAVDRRISRVMLTIFHLYRVVGES